MKKIIFDNKINLLFLLISFFWLINVVGIENISFKNIKWLHSLETSTHQIGWYFFKNDIWRFPLGSNPNYGEMIGNCIVFSDSIPILALFFKLFKSFISENFQYFSLWYFLCFYFQLFFSFKILKKFTNSEIYSLVGSFFFLIAPIFVYRVTFHAALSGQWILLLTLFLGLNYNLEQKKLSWLFLIIFSSLINFYFTAMIVATYSLLRLINLKFERNNFYELIKDTLIFAPCLLLVLYIVGYFEIRMPDTLGMGFAYHKLNFLSIFDPVNTFYSNSWSWFLPDIKLGTGEEIEGFNYFGLGQIMMAIFAMFLFFSKNYKTNLFSIRKNKKIRAFIIISIFLTLWALSSKISFGPYTLEIPLNKYIFGALSIVKSTGRLFWMVNYLVLTLSIIVIFKCFNKKKSLLIIILFFIIQIVDTSAGLKNYNRFFTPFNETIDFKNKIWIHLTDKNKILRTTYLVNWSKLQTRFSYFIEKNKIEKTNIVALGKMNRKAAADARYKEYENFRKRILESNVIYLVDSLGHLRHLKHIFENQDVGFFYRDNVWAMVANEKENMSDNDIHAFNEIKPKLLTMNQKEALYFEDNDSYYGFGWSHNFNKLGIWTEGPTATLLFRIDDINKDLQLEIYYSPYFTKKNNILEFDIYINNSFNKKMKLISNSQDEKLNILIKKNFLDNNKVKIDLEFKNLVSPLEALESPDSRKLGILVKNIRIKSI
mgnify:CR=1 FL=1|jgi:hypothetical protein|tara:strand:- start:496 stop:2631 length:2136 start_codon:yes stop_codon:yes gene_type:complete